MNPAVLKRGKIINGLVYGVVRNLYQKIKNNYSVMNRVPSLIHHNRIERIKYMKYGIFVIYENGQVSRYDDYFYNSPEDAYDSFMGWRIIDEKENKLPIGGLYFTVLPIWE